MKRLSILFLVIIITGCTSTVGNMLENKYRQQDLSNGFLVTQGMSKKAIIKIMGQPAKDEAREEVSEWYYCKQDDKADEFLAIVFMNNKVIAKKSYVVAYDDANGISSCENF